MAQILKLLRQNCANFFLGPQRSKKKMPKSQKPIDASRISQYRQAILVRTKSEFYIEYYVIHPANGILVRKRIRLNHLRKRYKTVAEFRQMAAEMVANINAKLAGGWSPFYQTENTRLYTPIEDVIRLFLAEKERELRPSTYRTYKSFCSMFLTWCNANAPQIYASLVNRVIATKYMDYLYLERKINAVAYNNNLKQARALFNWAVQKCYVKENPFELLQKKREGNKTRIMIPEDYRKQITSYLEEKDPYFLIVCNLVFTSLIRPKEVRIIQIKHINIAERYIRIPGENAKNHHERYAAINDTIANRLLYTLKKNPEYYLFGPNMLPGKEPCHESYFRKQWDKLRTALKLPVEMQLYSLRDTGINNMLKSGIDPLTVMQHADHHDLAMTTRYANHADPNLIKKIVENAPKF